MEQRNDEACIVAFPSCLSSEILFCVLSELQNAFSEVKF